MSRRVLAAIALFCPVALGACQAPRAPADLTAFVPAPAPGDAQVARLAEQLDRYCDLTRAAIAAFGIFGPAKLRPEVTYASAVIDGVCVDRPRDVPTALATISRAYTAVLAASHAR